MHKTSGGLRTLLLFVRVLISLRNLLLKKTAQLAITETVGGLLVVLGLGFRPVCVFMVINLIVAAVFTYAVSGNFDDATHAIEDAITFAGLFLIGPGAYSIDEKFIAKQ